VIGEEQLMAYADGELSAEEAARVAAAVEADPTLQAKLERHRRLKATLADAFAGDAEEPVPERLRAAVAAQAGAPPELVDLEAVRAAREAQVRRERRPAPRRAMAWALAAGLAALAIVLSVPLLKSAGSPHGSDLVRLGSDGMTAKGPLASALDRQLASAPPAGARVAVALTFKDRQGRWCRSFSSSQDALAGLACRDGARWRVQVLAAATEAPASPGQFRTAASSTPAAVQAAVDATLAGEPLSAEAERRVRDGGWRR
jgi:anti-sigma factor RsiW